MTEFTAHLRGVNFRPIEAKAIVNGLVEGQMLLLEREPANQFDEFAIKVLDPETGTHLGYVAKEVAAELAPIMDANTHVFECLVDSNMMRQVTLRITDEIEEESDA